MGHEPQRSSGDWPGRAVACLALWCVAACIPTGDQGGEAIPPVSAFPQIDGGTIAIPNHCQVTSPQPPSAFINFRFRNQGTQPVYFRGTCAPEYAIGSCAGNYTDDVTARGSTGCECEFRGQCPVGGPCAPIQAEIAPGDSLTVSWPAKVWVRSTTGNGIECNSPVDLPNGVYEVRIALFADPATAQAGTPVLRTVRRRFNRPSDDPVVDVPITP